MQFISQKPAGAGQGLCPCTLGFSAGQSPAPQVFGEQDAFIGTSAQT